MTDVERMALECLHLGAMLKLSEVLSTVAEKNPSLEGRCHKATMWCLVTPAEDVRKQALLRYVSGTKRKKGTMFLDDIEDISSGKLQEYNRAMEGKWRSENGVLVPEPSNKEDEPKPPAPPTPTPPHKPKRLERLRPIKGVASCDYEVDVASNSITHKPSKSSYQIPRGDASHVVNQLVRGMVRGIRNRRSWLVKFERKEEKILHRNGDGTRFYKKCVVRTPCNDGPGHTMYGGKAQLRSG